MSEPTAIETGGVRVEYDGPMRATWGERLLLATVVLIVAGVIASIVAYEFVKLDYSHESRLRHDCYQAGGIWNHGCQWPDLKTG